MEDSICRQAASLGLHLVSNSLLHPGPVSICIPPIKSSGDVYLENKKRQSSCMATLESVQ